MYPKSQRISVCKILSHEYFTQKVISTLDLRKPPRKFLLIISARREPCYFTEFQNILDLLGSRDFGNWSNSRH
jgi:hypothetical protein